MIFSNTVTKDHHSPLAHEPTSPEALAPLASDPLTCRDIGCGSSSTKPEAGNGPRRVLLVDDHADMLAMMHLVLSRRGYMVQTHSDARQALEAANAFQPHVVISDIGMPGMNGLDFMRALRLDGSLAPFKSVALTGFSSDADENDAIAAGFEVCLVKPVDFAALFQCLDKLCPVAEH